MVEAVAAVQHKAAPGKKILAGVLPCQGNFFPWEGKDSECMAGIFPA